MTVPDPAVAPAPAPEDVSQPAPSPAEPVSEGYMTFEVSTANEVSNAFQRGDLDGTTRVLVELGTRMDVANKEEAVLAAAKERDQEGATFAATTKRFWVERTPRKQVDVRWS